MELSFHHICKASPDMRDRLKCAFYHQRMSITALNKFTIIGLSEIYHIVPSAHFGYFFWKTNSAQYFFIFIQLPMKRLCIKPREWRFEQHLNFKNMIGNMHADTMG